jgi:arsenical pump membrane protein
MTLKRISWSVLPLVAGLFVLVEALAKTGLIAMIGSQLQLGVAHSEFAATWAAGVIVAVVSNLVNNLPAGLIAAGAVESARVPEHVQRAVLIGVDLGPNLSVTGSLATILWLGVLRREGLTVGVWTFFKLGMLVMPAALLLAIGASLPFG